jgi:mersacidin/lichenicidin family type 2 lantibiotic
MRKIDVMRAWQDEEYRNGMTEQERSLLPQNTAGNQGESDRPASHVMTGTVVDTTHLIGYWTETYFRITGVLQ